jgi:hypothetical protein
MLFRLKLSLEKQILLIAALAVLACAINWHFMFTPSLKMNLKTLGEGLAAGLICSAGAAALQALIVYFKPAICLASLRETTAVFNGLNVLTTIGAGITAGSGEELLLRGCLFALVAQKLFWLALLINFALTLILYYRGRKHLIWSSIKALECSGYALLYYYERSLFLIAAAHFTAEISSMLLPRLKIVGYALDHIRVSSPVIRNNRRSR